MFFAVKGVAPVANPPQLGPQLFRRIEGVRREAVKALPLDRAFHRLVRHYFHGSLKPPFNEEKRAEAGLPPDFYWPLAEGLQTQ